MNSPASCRWLTPVCSAAARGGKRWAWLVPGLVQPLGEFLPGSVHGIAGQEGQGQVSEEGRQLGLRLLAACLGDRSDIECGGKAGAVGAGRAVDQQWLGRLRHQGDELLGLFPAQGTLGRHPEIDVVNAERLRIGDFSVVPVLAGIAAAQVDDGPDAVTLDIE